MLRDHPEIIHHFDSVPGNRSLSAVEVGLVNVMSRETVLSQYVDSVKRDYDYVLLDCRPSLGMLFINVLFASDHVSAPVIKCKKTPRKKCSFMAERRKKR